MGSSSPTSIRQLAGPSSVASDNTLLLLNGLELRGDELVTLELAPPVSAAETRPTGNGSGDELPAGPVGLVQGKKLGVLLFGPRQALEDGKKGYAARFEIALGRRLKQGQANKLRVAGRGGLHGKRVVVYVWD